MSGVDHPFAIVPLALLADVTASAVVVYAVLAEAINQDTGEWAIARETIQERASVSRATATRAIKQLRAAGWISVREQFDENGQQLENIYGVYRVRRAGGEGSKNDPHVGSKNDPPRGSKNDPRKRPDPSPDPSDPTPLPTFVGETKPACRRDPVFDAIATATGINLDELSKDDGKRIGMVAADLRNRWQSDPDDLPTEISTRVRRLRSKWGDKTVTPTALAKHWAGLGEPKRSEDPSDRFAGSEAERILKL